jgi:general secretion pathway protein G
MPLKDRHPVTGIHLSFFYRLLKADPGERGFTLIEILVVVVIIGLLAGLVAINLIPRAEEAKRTAAFTQMRAFEQALELFKLDNGRYPSTQEGLEILVAPPGGKEPYLKGGKIPSDPWGHPYVYVGPGGSTAQGRPYDILSYGSDGQPGGTGDSADISVWDIHGKPEEKP